MQHKQQRVLAAQDHDFHRLAALEVFVAMDAPVLALGDLAADRLAVVHLRAIGAEIEPTVVGVLRHHAISGADKARLVELMVARHRKLEHIDLVALDHILQDRSIVDETRRQHLQILHARVIALHDVDLAGVFERQAECQRHATDRREMAIEGAKTLGIAGYLVEQDRRRSAAAFLGQHVGDGAHLDIPVGAVDVKEFSHALHFFEPAAQAVAVVHALIVCDVGKGHGILPGELGRFYS
jgi:hypothetical protein